MVRGIDVEYHTSVRSVEVVGEGVRVGDQNGRIWEADKVLWQTTVVVNVVFHYGSLIELLWSPGGCHGTTISAEGRKHTIFSSSWRQEVWSHRSTGGGAC